MSTSLFIWAVLVILGVSDAKMHRIPNKFLILLIVLLFLDAFFQTPYEELWAVLLNKCLAFLIAFAFGMILHLLRITAPGDVKMVAVLGFCLGTGGLVNYFYYVCLITVFVGTMYWFLNRLQLAPKVETNFEAIDKDRNIDFTNIAVSMQLSQQDFKRKLKTGNDLTYMPFAPILVMGLALHQYYS